MVAVGRNRERRYYFQNWRADVSAIVTDEGSMVEWVKYSAYGVAFGLPAGDTDSDGDYDGDDKGRIGTGAYDVRKDVNLDGTEDSDDVDQGNAVTGGNHALGRGVLSAGGVGGAASNRRGYAGYEYAPELEGTGAAGRHLYHVRHRVYDADVGRWTRRDPLGYVDGMGLYEYVGGMAVARVDPDGRLAAVACDRNVISTCLMAQQLLGLADLPFCTILQRLLPLHPQCWCAIPAMLGIMIEELPMRVALCGAVVVGGTIIITVPRPIAPAIPRTIDIAPPIARERPERAKCDSIGKVGGRSNMCIFTCTCPDGTTSGGRGVITEVGPCDVGPAIWCW